MQWAHTHVLGQVLIEKRTIPTRRKRIRRKKKKEYFTISQSTGSRRKWTPAYIYKLNWIYEEKIFLFLSFLLLYIYDAIPVEWFWENYSLLLEIYSKSKKEKPKAKADSSTNTKRKKRKEKKKNRYSTTSVVSFFFNFPFPYSSHSTARVCVCAFGHYLNKEDPVERSRYKCSTELYWSKRKKKEMNINEHVDEWHMCLCI
jgi:hypothetical protein